MENKLQYKFSIRRIEASSDPDFVLALKIYNETTPYEIKTNTNEIVTWLNNDEFICPFEPMYFALYFSNQLSGFAMMTYIRSQRLVVLEYIALELQFRINTVFFTYINMLENYLSINQYDVAFIVNEVSNRRDGNDIDKESQLFSKLLCIEGYGRLEAPYITPPLGTSNHESSFDAFLFVKSTGEVHCLERQTYLEIVKAIYFDYFLVWYTRVLSQNEVKCYREILNQCFDRISNQIALSSSIIVSYTECPILKKNSYNQKTYGLPPATPKKPRLFLYILLVILLFAFPFVTVWGYNVALSFLNIPIGSVSSVIGSFIGSCLTACATLWVAKKKL